MKKIILCLTALFSVMLFTGCSKPQGIVSAPSKSYPSVITAYTVADWLPEMSNEKAIVRLDEIEHKYYYSITVTWEDCTFVSDLTFTHTYSGYLVCDNEMHIVAEYLPNNDSYIELGVGAKRTLLGETGPQVNYDSICLKVVETSKIKVKSIKFNKLYSTF